MNRPLFAFFCCFFVSSSLLPGVDFNRDVRPILSDKCFACHGPDEHDRKAGLRLDTAEGAFGDLGGYAAFVPNDPDESEGWLRIISEDPDEVMPPPKFHKELTSGERETLRQWIEQGADFQMHWSFKALERPDVPDVEGKWVRNEIDSFVLEAQQERQLAPSPEADKVSLIRRLYLDLLGLSPNSEEVAAFVNDPAPDAYAKTVDRLLANPAFGERMAVYWLDLVRYADTIGYHSDNLMEVSAYRDYVIEAFNQNLPYDRFTIEQLAGDLLPDATRNQRVASGYNRLLQTTEEGGAQAKEYQAIYAADRVRNVSEVWLATTIGCAQCHDHKYDPFSARDFYSMAAFFADVKEKPIGKRIPNLKLPTAAEEAELASLRTRLEENTVAKLLGKDPDLAEQVHAAQRAWEESTGTQLASGENDWQIGLPKELKSSGGATLKTQPDGSVLTSGRNSNTDHYTVVLEGTSEQVTAIRLEVLTDATMTKQSLSRGNGNFVLTSFEVSHQGVPVKLDRALADYEQPGWPVAHAIDQDKKTGWGGNGHVEAKSRTAVFLFATPLDLAKDEKLLITLKHESSYQKHAIGRFRLALTNQENPTPTGGLDLPIDVRQALGKPVEQRSAAQQGAIASHYQSVAPLLSEARDNLTTWKSQLETIEKNIQTMLVSEAVEPRMTRILPRGNWLDDSGEEVQPAVPVFLPHEPIEDRRATRLDLANWIVSDTNPLTARAMANRLWKLFYGAGISKNLGDLGGQGEPPSHPELLDWLAVEFRESGWDIKHMVKLMVTSGTYRQTSIETPEIREADPGNVWLTRQGRWRLDAEFVRDVALDVSGLLVDELGGKSVKPYQPPGYWEHLNFPRREWKDGEGDALYRRGLYTFWCRSFLHPAMLAFDAPSREECTAERARSNTPQQALVLLNDPVFVEASRAFAARIAQQSGDADAKMRWAWRNAVSRQPTEVELDVLRGVYSQQKAKFSEQVDSAELLIQTGDSPLPAEIDPAELAAWTQVARTIINAYETTSRN